MNSFSSIPVPEKSTQAKYVPSKGIDFKPGITLIASSKIIRFSSIYFISLSSHSAPSDEYAAVAINNPKLFGLMPRAAILFENFWCKSGLEIITFPECAPAILKVFVVAVIITKRSHMAGSAIGITVCLFWGYTRS